IVLISLGAGALVFWLLRTGVSPWFALTWAGACGPLDAFSHGLPDAAGDALFIVALSAVWFHKLGLYAFVMSLLVLTREGYVVVAFAVWCASVAGLLRWRGRGFRPRLALTAIPGAALVAWTAYLWLHFGQGPFSSERSPEGLYGW